MAIDERLPPAYLDHDSMSPPAERERRLCRKIGCPNRASVDGLCDEHASSQYLDGWR